MLTSSFTFVCTPLLGAKGLPWQACAHVGVNIWFAWLQVSEAKKKRAASKKAKAPGAAATKEAASPNENNTPTNGSMQDLTQGVEDLGINNERSCTSILTSHPQSRDIHLESFTLLFHGHELLVDTDLELNFGRQGS